jgi:primosomal protein N' (replication factor Y)
MPLDKAYDYIAPRPLPRGAFVIAPFGPQRAPGVVWSGPAREGGFDAGRLKAIEHVFDAPRLSEDVLDFVQWAAAYTATPLGLMLRLTMRSGDALSPPKGEVVLSRGGAEIRPTPQREAVFAALGDRALAPSDLAERAGVSAGVVRAMVRAGALREEALDPDPPFAAPDISRPGRSLSAQQTEAVRALRALIERPSPPPVLLDGVTGSGKTEVYLEAIAAALASDERAQALILLPEIALTMPFLERVEERFGAAPAAWHSDMTHAARRRVWRRVLEGQARLIVGARSALFLPFQRLRCIVVDEEHDGAYKQEDGVIYQARDLAVARGARGGFPVLLASATPSLETVVNVDQGRYEIVRLPDRFGGARMPAISTADLRHAPPAAGDWLSPPLIAGVEEALGAGSQALLFLNRRGYAPLTICRRCGHRMKAPDSDTWLVEHRFENRLICHHTGYSIPKPSACPACGAVGGLSACGPGVERVAEEAARLWPEARRAILSSDIAGPAQIRATLDAMKAGEIDILIATQIVAKGHTFPKLTFVGVVDADLGLSGGDLRAAERTFQLLSQVAGRAGRAERPGKAILQTYQPDAPVLTALAGGHRDDFLAAEAEGRRAMQFPPYGRLAAVILKSKNEKQLVDCARAHHAAAPIAEGAQLWGPAPAPIYRLRGEARIRFLLRARRDFNVQAFLEEWLRPLKVPGAVRRIVDVDPYSFL